MKIGMVSDSLANLSFGEMITTAKKLGVSGIEFNTGNWSTSPHLNLGVLLSSQSAREEFVGQISEQDLEVISFNCNGNQLHPREGAEHDQVVRHTIKLSGLMGLRKVCLMSGLPGAGPTEQYPNWIVSSWPPDTQRVLEWQWRERLVPYWKELVKFGADHGVQTFAVEMHGNQLVYSPRTLMQLREEAGASICANLDPSHLMWMGADPILSAEYLGSAIAHVHGKDTALNPPVLATASLLENGPLDDVRGRSWNHCTLGYGRDAKWWSDFCYRLRMVGYDEWISIEHEDSNQSRLEGLRKAVDLLKASAIIEAPDYRVQAIQSPLD
jgi:sugar phosphate isomerase/epimerase